jgi:hypothetical protein
VNGVGEDVVLEAEGAVEHVAAARPAVLHLLRHAELPGLEGVRGELVQQPLLGRSGGVTDHRETTERHGAGSESHRRTTVVVRPATPKRLLSPLQHPHELSTAKCSGQRGGSAP